MSNRRAGLMIESAMQGRPRPRRKHRQATAGATRRVVHPSSAKPSGPHGKCSRDLPDRSVAASQPAIGLADAACPHGRRTTTTTSRAHRGRRARWAGVLTHEASSCRDRRLRWPRPFRNGGKSATSDGLERSVRATDQGRTNHVDSSLLLRVSAQRMFLFRSRSRRLSLGRSRRRSSARSRWRCRTRTRRQRRRLSSQSPKSRRRLSS